MVDFAWGPDEERRLQAIRNDLAKVSTATACQLMISQGWRNGYMLGLLPLRPLGLGNRLVGRARTCRYLSRRGPEGAHDPAKRRVSPEIVLIEDMQPGDVLCVDALGITSAGIIGDILSARLKANEAAAAVIHGVVRDSPYITQVGLPVFCAGVHPSHSGRDLIPVDFDRPIEMAGVQVLPGDIILADDEGVIAMPLDLAEYIASLGPRKKNLKSGSGARSWLVARSTTTIRRPPKRLPNTSRKPGGRSIHSKHRSSAEVRREDHRYSHR